jgi:hypothetical protein
MFYRKQTKRNIQTLWDLYGVDSSSKSGKFALYFIWVLMVLCTSIITYSVISYMNFPVVRIGGSIFYFLFIHLLIELITQGITYFIISLKT